jgi:hypothetical protein
MRGTWNFNKLEEAFSPGIVINMREADRMAVVSIDLGNGKVLSGKITVPDLKYTEIHDEGDEWKGEVDADLNLAPGQDVKAVNARGGRPHVQILRDDTGLTKVDEDLAGEILIHVWSEGLDWEFPATLSLEDFIEDMVEHGALIGDEVDFVTGYLS